MATEKNAKKTTEVATTGGYGEIAQGLISSRSVSSFLPGE